MIVLFIVNSLDIQVGVALKNKPEEQKQNKNFLGALLPTLQNGKNICKKSVGSN